MQEKILIIQTAFLGDSVLTLPMIQKVKELYPASIISVLCIPSTKELFEHSPSVNEVIVYDKKGKQKSIFSFFRLNRLIHHQRFTRIYSPHRSLRTTLIIFLSGCKLTYGFNTASWSFIYKSRIEYIKNKHEVARNLDLIGYNTSSENWKILPKIKIDNGNIVKIQNVLKEMGNNKIVAIAPGSVWNTKIYPKEYIISIIEFLRMENYGVVLLGGIEDKLLCEEIEKSFSNLVLSYSGKLSIIESIALLRNCSLLISNDSAPTHLGMIADIPTLTIYCSTVPAFGFSPYNSTSKSLSFDDLKCKPCGIHGYKKCPIETFDCGLKLTPPIVIDALKEMLTF